MHYQIQNQTLIFVPIAVLKFGGNCFDWNLLRWLTSPDSTPATPTWVIQCRFMKVTSESYFSFRDLINNCQRRLEKSSFTRNSPWWLLCPNNSFYSRTTFKPSIKKIEFISIHSVILYDRYFSRLGRSTDSLFFQKVMNLFYSPTSTLIPSQLWL